MTSVEQTGAVRDIEVDRAALDTSIAEFTEQRAEYYANAFHTIHDSTGSIPRTFNIAAFLAGPFGLRRAAPGGCFGPL